MSVGYGGSRASRPCPSGGSSYSLPDWGRGQQLGPVDPAWILLLQFPNGFVSACAESTQKAWPVLLASDSQGVTGWVKQGLPSQTSVLP